MIYNCTIFKDKTILPSFYYHLYYCNYTQNKLPLSSRILINQIFVKAIIIYYLLSISKHLYKI